MLKYTKYSYLNKRIPYILLFCFSALGAQKITIINNTDEPIIVKNGKKEEVVKEHRKNDFSDTSRLAISGQSTFSKYINLFLEPTDKLSIAIEKDKSTIYTGNQAALNQYINEELTEDTFGKINAYESAGEKKNINELKNTSELLFADILRKAKLSSILVSSEDKISVKRLKTYMKYNWLNTIFFTLNRQDKTFKKEALNYYYKRYIEMDIAKYSCGSSFQYGVLETLVKNKDLLQAELPTYPIVEHTDDDAINQYLPQNCQREYFLIKYKYLDHINGHNKEYYQRVLREKFNEQ